jgi:Fe-Mn family superoxide dismutase
MNSNYNLIGLKQDVMNLADKIDGSGWISVGLTPNGKIEIFNYPGEYNHIQNSLINFDLWEHAYYLQFKYDWEAYVDTLYELIDWKIVGMRYRRIRNSLAIV